MDFITLQGKVASWLNRSDLTAQIPDFVNIALHDLEGGAWNYKYMEIRQQTTTSDSFITMPTRYKDVKWLKYIGADGRYKDLKRESSNTIIEEYPDLNTSLGPPEKFAAMANQNEFLIRPTPDMVYTYDAAFYVYSPDLSADGDTNWWLTNAWEVLLYGALISAAAFLGDDARIPIWQGLYEKAIKDVQELEARENLGGSGPQGKTLYAV